MKKLILMAVAASLSLGCAPEPEVDITLLTSIRDSSLIVEDDYIELTEGEAIGVQVDAVRDEETREDWRILAKSENGSVASISGTSDERTFVIIGRRPGTTELRFELRGSDLVYVPIKVREREAAELPPSAAAGASNN